MLGSGRELAAGIQQVQTQRGQHLVVARAAEMHATTGRAVSFLAPTLFGLSITIFGSQRFGILGILIVLLAGLLALLPVKEPREVPTAQSPSA